MNKKVQILRGIAAIAVVTIHAGPGGYANVFLRPFLSFAVALFIFLSGYLTKMEIPDLKRFYKKRLLRVVVPYVAWSLIWTIVDGDYSNLLINLLTANSNSTYYYIFVYMQLVVITPLIPKLIRSKARWIGYWISPLSIIIMRFLMIGLHVDIAYPWYSSIFTHWFVFYYLGMLLGNQVIKYSLGAKETMLMYAGLLVLSEIEGFLWYRAGNMDMATTQLRLTSLLTSVGAVMISYLYIKDVIFPLRENRLAKLLIVLGNCSFGMYFAHTLILLGLDKLFPHSQLFIFPSKAVIAIVISTGCIMAGKRIMGRASWVLGV